MLLRGLIRVLGGLAQDTQLQSWVLLSRVSYDLELLTVTIDVRCISIIFILRAITFILVIFTAQIDSTRKLNFIWQSDNLGLFLWPIRSLVWTFNPFLGPWCDNRAILILATHHIRATLRALRVWLIDRVALWHDLRAGQHGWCHTRCNISPIIVTHLLARSVNWLLKHSSMSTHNIVCCFIWGRRRSMPIL